MNFRRRRPKDTGQRRGSWWTFEATLRRVFRQSGGVEDPRKSYEEEQAMWAKYLEEHYGDENW